MRVRKVHKSLVAAVAFWVPLVVSQLALDGCTNVITSPGPPISIGPGTTSVSVDPSAFLGSVICSDQPGGMRSYVATITDVKHPCTTGADCRSGSCALGICVDENRPCAGDDDCFPGVCAPAHCSNKPSTACTDLTDCACLATDPSTCKPGVCLGQVCAEAFTFPSSPPVSCAQSTYFEYVTVGASVIAQVDGYDLSADQLVPVCGQAGPPQQCQTDAECPVAFGCQGRCLTSAYYDPSASDLGQSLIATSCQAAPDPMGSGAVKECGCSYTVTEGDRHMYNRATKAPIAPKWTMGDGQACGLGASPPQAQAFVNVSIAPCPEFSGPDGGGPDGGMTGTVRVIPYAALPSSLACKASGTAGTVTVFDVIPADPSLMPSTGLVCAAGTQVTYPDLVPSKSYAFKLQAYEGGAQPTQTATCFATPIAGVTVTAMCDPLVPVK